MATTIWLNIWSIQRFYKILSLILNVIWRKIYSKSLIYYMWRQQYDLTLEASKDFTRSCANLECHLKKNIFKVSNIGKKLQYLYSELWPVMMAKYCSGILLCMCPANERQRYNVTLSRIGWAHTQKDPWLFSGMTSTRIAPTKFASRIYKRLALEGWRCNGIRRHVIDLDLDYFPSRSICFHWFYLYFHQITLYTSSWPQIHSWKTNIIFGTLKIL